MAAVRKRRDGYYAVFYVFGRARWKRLLGCSDIVEAQRRVGVVDGFLGEVEEAVDPDYGSVWVDRVIEYGCAHAEEGLVLDLGYRVGVLLRGSEDEVLSLDLLPEIPDPIERWPFGPGTYFATAHDRMRIGEAQSVSRKLREMRHHCPFEVRLRAVGPVGLVDALAREQLEEYRVPWGGPEWYYLRGPVVDLLRRARLRWDQRSTKKKPEIGRACETSSVGEGSAAAAPQPEPTRSPLTRRGSLPAK